MRPRVSRLVDMGMGMRAKEGGEVNKWRGGGADLGIQHTKHARVSRCHTPAAIHLIRDHHLTAMRIMCVFEEDVSWNSHV